jgi:TonB family protein
MRALIAVLFATVVTAVGQAPVESQGKPTKAIAIFAPKPKYPESLKKRGIGGQGEFVMHVEPKTGLVTSVDVVKSTGVRALDDSVVHAFREWRFERNKCAPVVRSPVRFDPHGLTNR